MAKKLIKFSVSKNGPKYPPKQETIADVFIIESLEFEDEEGGVYEGKILSDTLKMCGKNPKYFYFRTEAELIELAKKFRMSGYRYLHISCHGNDEAIYSTLDEIKYDRLGEIFSGLLANRRLFVSACEVGNKKFSDAMSNDNNGMYSILCPSDAIRMDYAVAIWSAFYVRLFSLETKLKKGIKRKAMTNTIQQLCNFFEVKFHLSTYLAHEDDWEHISISKE